MSVLDEATSALDETAENVIGQVPSELRRRASALAIAHRGATIEGADGATFVVDGRIAYDAPTVISHDQAMLESRQALPQWGML